MSVNGLQQPYVNNSLDGLVYVEVDGLTINGIPVDPTTFIPYTGATKPVSLGPFSLETLTSLSARQVNFTTFTSSMMTGPTTSSLFTADAWQMSNTIQISSLGTTSTSYLHIRDTTNSSTLLTLQSNGIADFGSSIPRASTLATGNYDLVNLSTLSNAVAYLEGITSLNFVPYVGSLNNLNMGASTIKTTGYVSTAYLTLSESTNSEAWTIYTLSTMGNLSTLGGLVIQEKGGNSVYLTGGVVGAKNFQFSSPGGGNASKVVCTDGNSVMSTTISAGQLGYITSLTSQAGGIGQTNTWSNTQTFSVAPTLNGLTTTTPSFSLGIDGSNQIVKYTPAASGGTVNTSTTTARFLPYLSTGTTLTNSLLNQIDNDSIGLGYTAIPTYPLGSAKNMYINGSIFAGGLNSMVGTFGRDTNTSNPANEINFTANGAGVLVSQIKSHSGSSAFYDATWTYSNTNPAPLGANQGQVLLTADKLSLSLPSGLVVAGGSLTMSITKPIYLYNTSGTNNAGILCESSGDMVFFTGTAGTATRLRIASGGDVVASNNLTANCLIVNGGGTYQAGSIYSDANWGMLFRAKVVPIAGIFGWYDSAGVERMKMLPNGTLQLSPPGDGPGFVHTNGTVIVESYIGGAGGWFGTRTNHPLRFYTNNSSARVTLNTGGDMTHTAGDSSYMKYGPNSTWSASIVVGATPDKSGASTAQVITTNGNLHLDAGNSNAMYYGYYANSRGTPNSHQFYGNDYNFIGVPQNFNAYSHVCVFAGDQMRRSQCVMRQIYRNESVSWAGGINMTYAFYKYNAQCPVRISGKYAMYSTYVGIQTMGMRLYSQTSGAYFYYQFRTYQNISIAQTTYPFEIILTDGDLGAFSTGWYDIYIYNVGGCSTDGNDQLHLSVQLLPVNSF